MNYPRIFNQIKGYALYKGHAMSKINDLIIMVRAFGAEQMLETPANNPIQ